jgi:hypothetical protein
MVGRKLTDMFPPKKPYAGRVLLDVGHLSSEKVTDLSFTVRAERLSAFPADGRRTHRNDPGAFRHRPAHRRHGHAGRQTRPRRILGGRSAGRAGPGDREPQGGGHPAHTVGQEKRQHRVAEPGVPADQHQPPQGTSEVKKLSGAIQIKTPSIDQLVSSSPAAISRRCCWPAG